MQAGASLISIDAEKMLKVLLPRTTGKFTRQGLKVNGLRYRNSSYTERFLSGGDAVAAYNPDDVDTVWLIECGSYIPFTLIEGRYTLRRNQHNTPNRLLHNPDKESVSVTHVDFGRQTRLFGCVLKMNSIF